MDKTREITKHTITNIMHELYLYRESTVDVHDMTYEEFDNLIAECAREEQQRISSLSRTELAREMLELMISTIVSDGKE